MTKRIFKAICIVAISVFTASLAIVMGILYGYLSGSRTEQLKIETDMCAGGVEAGGMDYINSLDTSGWRLTWIAEDGTVLYDSETDSSQMENHNEREEVKEARKNGYGESERYSTTLTERQMYCAKLIDDGTVLRLSDSQYTWWTILLSMMQPILFIVTVAVAISLLLAFRLSKNIVKPLNSLNLDSPLENSAYPELEPLLSRLAAQQHQLKLQASELERKRNEFLTATGNMMEGIVLLSDKGELLSINAAASRLLGVSPYCVGKDILLLNNSYEMQELVHRALSGEHTETTLPVGGSDYQINATPVMSDGKVAGAALVIFDVTEKEKAEQIRREFTANVSHELKTPLQSISGCAELLSNGMVKPEDVPEFSHRIYSESQRLISLVEDIIGLSRLDEGAEDMQRTNVDLHRLAETAIDSLSNAAKEAGVALELCGDGAEVYGIPQLLGTIVYNLCDNAIKYNRRGGSVTVTTENGAGGVTLTVSDTGIGIPKDQQDRIFERFYRVDKSHSKDVGGTGLGLSIVKHAALLHNATVTVDSTPGAGTTFTVFFPSAAE